MKILIVDDEFINREVLKAILEPYGSCILAENGEEAVTLFKEALAADSPFELVLLDILMPIMDGQEALKKMRKTETLYHKMSLDEKKPAFILMVTTVEDLRQLTEAFIEGRCNGYLNKPIDAEELIGRLKKHQVIV